MASFWADKGVRVKLLLRLIIDEVIDIKLHLIHIVLDLIEICVRIGWVNIEFGIVS